MKRFKQTDHGDRGWFIGHWANALIKTEQFEIAHGFNPAGDHSPNHFHKEALEISLITSGKAEVNGEIFNAGEGFIMEPGDRCECHYIEDTYTLVVKTPSVTNDKYYI